MTDFVSYKMQQLMERTAGGKFARKVFRNIAKEEEKEMSKSSTSEFAGLKSRRERRAEARANKVPFEPQHFEGFEMIVPVRKTKKNKAKKSAENL